MATTNKTATQDEQLVAILTRIQRMHTEWYTLMTEHWDWLVVLQCMQDHGFFKSNPARPPFAAFDQWLRHHDVPQYLAHCSVRNLTYVNNKIAGAQTQARHLCHFGENAQATSRHKPMSRKRRLRHV